MKARLARFVGLFLLLFIPLNYPMLSLHAAPRQQSDLPAGEPNNTFGSAVPITVGSTIEGTIAPSGDADWYEVNIDQQGELQIVISNVAEELALVVRVWNSNRDAVSDWFAPLAPGGDTEALVDLALPGRYFLEVGDNNGNVESDQPYSLQTSFTPTVDAGEPNNNTFGRAAALELGQTVQANILPAGDVDWYSFEVPGHGELNAKISNVSSELAISYRLWSANYDALSDWVSPLAQGGETVGTLDLPSAGKYFLEVAAEGGERATQPYTLDASFAPAADSFEPNNSFGTAAPLPLGESVVANMVPTGDEDWYQINVPHHGELTIAVTDVPENLAIQARVWSSNRDAVSDWLSPLSAGGETNAVVDLPMAGSYFLQFVDANSERSIEPFTLTVSFVEATDPNENNDTFGRATPLTVGQSYPSNILPATDRDWYRVDLDHHGELQVIASDVPENLDINFRVWNSNYDAVSDWFAPLALGGNTSGFIDIATAGAYYIEVANGSNNARSTAPFLLQTLFIPAADQSEPNNSFEMATVATLDTTIPGNIIPASDTDWYSIEVAEGGDLHVLVTNVAPQMQMVYRLWDDQEAVIGDWVYPLASGGNTEGVFSIAEAGTYFLEVADNQGNRAIQPYLLRFSMEEIDRAEMTFTQTLTNTDILTDIVATVEEGTETITTTTTIVTMTTTMETSGEVGGSETITATDALSNTTVITKPVSTRTTPSTPTTPATDETPGDSDEEEADEEEAEEAGADEDAEGEETDETAPEVSDGASITETAEMTATPEIDDSSEITETPEITDTEPTTTTGAVPPPTTQATTGVPNSMDDAVIPEGEVVTVEGIDVVQPTGWQAASESGPFRGLALNPDDLTAAAPQGPRLWVLSPGVEDLQFTGTLEPLGEGTQVVEETTTFQIGEYTATAIAVEEMVGDQSVIRRYVFVNTGEGESYEFILESPADLWEEQVPMLEGILASVLIQPQ